MRDSDGVAFAAIFSKLRTLFPLRGGAVEIQQIADSYFRVLMRFPLRAVEAGAEAWIEKGEHFPKPAQWLQSIPRQKSAEYLTMPDDLASEHRRAVELHYQDEPCRCHECKRAEVTHRMRRYVPEEDGDGQDARMMLDGKVVVRGHWAHGDELARWYAARDGYLALKDQHPGKFPRVMKKPLSLIGAAAGGDREE